jgi:hypothetical protein
MDNDAGLLENGITEAEPVRKFRWNCDMHAYTGPTISRTQTDLMNKLELFGSECFVDPCPAVLRPCSRTVIT